MRFTLRLAFKVALNQKRLLVLEEGRLMFQEDLHL